MRGDRPSCFGSGFGGSTFTPHARGSTLLPRSRPRLLPVYPACAGIDPLLQVTLTHGSSLPRMRGDRPPTHPYQIFLVQFTPHARGSTAQKVAEEEGMDVYPACAGIDLVFQKSNVASSCLPRMRGDRPRRPISYF